MKMIKRIVIMLVFLAFASGGTAFAVYEWGQGQVNVNTATRDQLVWFLGQSNISNPDEVADNILAYRDASGPFDDLSELRNVQGVSDADLFWLQFRVKTSGDTMYEPEKVLPAPGNNQPYLPEKDS